VTVALLDRDGVEIFYQMTGTPSAKSPILLSHGYSATSEMWRPNLDALGTSRQVIVWDMRGHGRSAAPDSLDRYSAELSVQDMECILDAAGADTAIVGGLSLGGYLSLAFHLTHPARVEALMLFDTGPGFKSVGAREQWNASARKTAEDYEARGLAALPGRAETVRSEHRSAGGLALAARGMLTQADAQVIESLPGIKVPTLVLVGADDRPFLNAAEYMAAKIPAATKVVIDGAGHASNIDQPAPFNRAVIDFLESI
jgi:pimeloyl-ACP methyl ester carboxylesterase